MATGIGAPIMTQTEQSIANLGQQYAQNAGVNQLGSFLSRRRFGREREGAERQFRSDQPRFRSNFAQRGMMGSGIERQDMSDRFRSYQDYMNQMAEGQFMEQQQFEMAETQQQQAYQQALGQLMEQQQMSSAFQNPFQYFANPLLGLFGGQYCWVLFLFLLP
jgi:predicted acyl esterase